MRSGRLRVHRVELEVYDFNPRARHVYEKLGFVHEGTKRDALLWDGKWTDYHCMGLLDRDWATLSPLRT
jgi:RimJ/RimL family protein N-acetyltransferase